MSSEAPSNSSSKEGTPILGAGQRSIATIQPHEIKLLAQKMSNEYSLAKAAGLESEKGKQHMQKVNAIKNVLVKYKESQGKDKDKPSDSTNSNTGSPISINTPSTPLIPTGSIDTPSELSSRPQSVEPTNANANANAPAVSIETYNQVKTRIQDMVKRIKVLEDIKGKESDNTKIDEHNNEINNLKGQILRHQKALNYFKSQLQLTEPEDAPTPTSSQSPLKTQPQVQAQAQAQTQAQAQAQVPPKAPTQPQTQTQSQTQSNAKNQVSIPKNISTPSNNSINHAPVPTRPSNIVGTSSEVNLPGMATRPITSTTNLHDFAANAARNAAARNPIFNRPGLAGSSNHDVGFTSMPSINRFDHGPGQFNQNVVIPDNGGRVLTKRRLTELINTIGIEEGDEKTTIDNDAEDILLDLADEFVSSVTGFACKLAKHRKVDKLDIRDFQLHLERNWGVRVPGYAYDEIKAVKRWSTNPEYKENLNQIEKAKNENGTSK
ncbi:TFIID subunit (TBP-associated factor) [Scheffersomyces amazonensis]|uniref:TFIID subunit (TBP-associated factor) n=1 Tax=Scheffersomyces amazonensis TaxID=1078765 RepID=UPI00315CDB3C